MADVALSTKRHPVGDRLAGQKLDSTTCRGGGEKAGCAENPVVRGLRAALRFAALLPAHLHAHDRTGLR